MLKRITSSHVQPRSAARGAWQSMAILYGLFLIGFLGALFSLVKAVNESESGVVAFALFCLLIGVCAVGELLYRLLRMLNDRPTVGDLPSPLPVVATKAKPSSAGTTPDMEV